MGPDQRDQQQRGEERADKRARGRDRVQPPVTRSGLADAPSDSRFAYGATVPSSSTGTATSTSTASQRAEEPADRQRARAP